MVMGARDLRSILKTDWVTEEKIERKFELLWSNHTIRSMVTSRYYF